MTSLGHAALRTIRSRARLPSSQLLCGGGLPWIAGQGNISVLSSPAVCGPTLNHIPSPSTTLPTPKNGSTKLDGLVALAAATVGLVVSLPQSSAKCEGGEVDAELDPLEESETSIAVELPKNVENLFTLMHTPSKFQKVVKSVMEADKADTTCVLPVVAEIIEACFSEKSAEELVEHGNKLRDKLGSRLVHDLSEKHGSGFENKVNIERFSLDLAAQVVKHYGTTNDNGKGSDDFSQRNDSNGCLRTHMRSVGRYLASEYLKKTQGNEDASADYDPPKMALLDMFATTARKPDEKLGEGDEVLAVQVDDIAEVLKIHPEQYYVINWAVSSLSAVIYAKHNEKPQPMLCACHPAQKRYFGMTEKLGTRSFSTGLAQMSESVHGQVLLKGQQLFYKPETRALLSQSLVNFWGPIIDLPEDFVSEIADNYGKKKDMTAEAIEDLRLAKHAGTVKGGRRGGTKTGKKRSDAAWYYAVAIEEGKTQEEALDLIDDCLGSEHCSLQEGSQESGAMHAEAAFLYAALINAGSTQEEALDSIKTRLGPKHHRIQEGAFRIQEGTLRFINTNRTNRRGEKEIDYRKVGVSGPTKAGNWTVVIKYKGKEQRIGTYATLDDAAKANEAARKSLASSIGVSLSANAIDANIKSARAEAAKVATATINGTDGSKKRKIVKDPLLKACVQSASASTDGIVDPSTLSAALNGSESGSKKRKIVKDSLLKACVQSASASTDGIVDPSTLSAALNAGYSKYFITEVVVPPVPQHSEKINNTVQGSTNIKRPFPFSEFLESDSHKRLRPGLGLGLMRKPQDHTCSGWGCSECERIHNAAIDSEAAAKRNAYAEEYNALMARRPPWNAND